MQKKKKILVHFNASNAHMSLEIIYAMPRTCVSAVLWWLRMGIWQQMLHPLIHHYISIHTYIYIYMSMAMRYDSWRRMQNACLLQVLDAFVHCCCTFSSRYIGKCTLYNVQFLGGLTDGHRPSAALTEQSFVFAIMMLLLPFSLHRIAVPLWVRNKSVRTQMNGDVIYYIRIKHKRTIPALTTFGVQLHLSHTLTFLVAIPKQPF